LQDFNLGPLLQFFCAWNLDDFTTHGTDRFLRCLLNLEQFHFENEQSIRRDARTALCAVSPVRVDIELEFGAWLHELKTFGPTLDDTIQWEFGRLIALV